jgi:hypothetical protein
LKYSKARPWLKQLIFLVQSRHDETAEVLREFVGRLGFASSREGQYSQLAPRNPNNAHACWDFHCNLTSCSSFPWLLPTFVPPPAPWDANKRQDYFADHNCPGYAFRAICFETFGQLSPGAMQLWFFF